MAEELFIEKSIMKLKPLLHFAGIYITSGEENPREAFKYRLKYIFNFLALNTVLAGEMYYFIDGMRRGEDFYALTYTAPCLLISLIGNSKSYFLVVNEKHVQNLVANLKHLEKKAAGERTFEKDAIVKGELNFMNIVINVINILHTILVVAFALSPLLLMTIKYYQTDEWEFILPFLIIYPFDVYNITSWPFMYINQIWAELVVSIDMRCADHFFFICCTYIRIQFRLLKYDIERIIEDKDTSKLSKNDGQFKEKFVELIKWHQNLIESANMLEILYSKSTLINFLCSSLMICVTSFNVTVVDDTAFLLTFLDFLFISLIQVFFLCFFADRLMTSSMDITNGIYNCKWYLADANIRKQLLLVQTRAQKPCKLTASGFADVDLNQFMRVLSTSWSYFALLQTMYGGRN